jgi:5-hydroxyisourate hydrolase
MPRKLAPAELGAYRSGREMRQLLPEGEDPGAGIYRLIFDVASYYAAQNIETLYPVVEVTFQARAGESTFHVPLLLSPNGYTTYRGS